MVDYSKWDKFADDISSSDEEGDHGDLNTSGFMTAKGLGTGETGGGKRPKRGKYRFLDWAASDSGRGLPDVFFTNPEEFVPQIDPETGKIAPTWGVALGDLSFVYQRKMEHQFNYGLLSKGAPKEPPELQFYKVLKRKKIERLSHPDHVARRKELAKCDFILTITLCEVKPKIYRKFKVSGGVTLFTFADKILSPVMGWTRNYHAYVFVDRKDGAVYGPKKCDAIDMMHQDGHGWTFLDDRSYLLADLLQAQGEEAGYIYDLGDSWAHDIVVNEILPPESSDGKVVVLEGARACPPEDSCGIKGMGNTAYAEALKKKKVNYVEASAALNYKSKHAFHPNRFSVQECQADVLKELKSTSSTQTGAKILNIPLSNKSDASEALRSAQTKTEVVSTEPIFACGHGPTISETLRVSRDKANVALCHKCGSPHNLKVCGVCRGIRYCSRKCQVSDWPDHKPYCSPKK